MLHNDQPVILEMVCSQWHWVSESPVDHSCLRIYYVPLFATTSALLSLEETFVWGVAYLATPITGRE